MIILGGKTVSPELSPNYPKVNVSAGNITGGKSKERGYRNP